MENGKTWWKGSFPLWLVVLLLSVIGYGGERLMREIDGMHHTDEMLNIRISDTAALVAVLQSESKDFHESIVDLRRAQLEALGELRALTSVLLKERKL